MKKLLLLLLLIPTLSFADLGTTIYTATTGSGKTTSPGCVYVVFLPQGFTGSIGNASLSAFTATIPIYSAYQGGQGQKLNAIPYNVSSGTLVIVETK